MNRPHAADRPRDDQPRADRPRHDRPRHDRPRDDRTRDDQLRGGGPGSAPEPVDAFDPAAMLALVEGERARAERAVEPDVRLVYAVWGTAWLVGFLVFWGVDPAGRYPRRGPLPKRDSPYSLWSLRPPQHASPAGLQMFLLLRSPRG